MMKLKTYSITTMVMTGVYYLVSATHALASDYVPLSKGEGFGVIVDGRSDINTLLNGLLQVSVGIAAILAVIILSIGGFKYMTTDSIFQMGSAKEQITNAVVGLLIVLAAVLIMSTINPDIVSLNIFSTQVSGGSH